MVTLSWRYHIICCLRSAYVDSLACTPNLKIASYVFGFSDSKVTRSISISRHTLYASFIHVSVLLAILRGGHLRTVVWIRDPHALISDPCMLRCQWNGAVPESIFALQLGLVVLSQSARPSSKQYQRVETVACHCAISTVARTAPCAARDIHVDRSLRYCVKSEVEISSTVLVRQVSGLLLPYYLVRIGKYRRLMLKQTRTA